MSELLIASNNQGKVAEVYAILAELNLHLRTPKELGLEIEVEETGLTYAENASLKGLAFASAAGMLSLADDTGLEVKALNGAPGLRSKRFSPQTDATDADRRALLLERLSSYPPPWEARFVCVVAVVTPTREVYLSEGECRGAIIPRERGEHGFGYDPIFLIPELGMTMAELNLEGKNQISHRARAVRAAIPGMRTLLNR